MKLYQDKATTKLLQMEDTVTLEVNQIKNKLEESRMFLHDQLTEEKAKLNAARTELRKRLAELAAIDFEIRTALDDEIMVEMASKSEAVVNRMEEVLRCDVNDDMKTTCFDDFQDEYKSLFYVMAEYTIYHSPSLIICYF